MHWLPTRKKLLYTVGVANPARGLLNREKQKNKKVWQRPPPPCAARSDNKKKKKITRRIHMSRRYASRRHAGGLGPSRVRTRILTTRRLGQWVLLHKTLRFRVRLTFSISLVPYPRSCLVFCSRDVGSAVPPRVAPSIFRLRGESGACSQAPLLPPAFRGGAVLYCTVLYCTVLFASFDVMAVGTNSLSCGFNWQCTADMPLAICRYDHSTPGLLTVSSVTSTVWVHPGREAAGVEV